MRFAFQRFSTIPNRVLLSGLSSRSTAFRFNTTPSHNNNVDNDITPPSSSSIDEGNNNNNNNNSHQTKDDDKDDETTLAKPAAAHVFLRHTLMDNQAIFSTIFLNRALAANAMGRTMVQQLYDIVNELEQSDSRCVIISSCSGKVFSAGADLKERMTMTIEEARDTVDRLRALMERIAQLPMPVIAAVEGAALGGGLELALAADWRIAGQDAVFGFPETGLAIVPGAGGTQRLPRLIGVARAKELIFTARPIHATEAEKYGLVQQLVDVKGAYPNAKMMAKRIASNGPVAIKAAKFAIDKGMTCSILEDALDIERQAYLRVLETSDRIEGLEAFNEERPPNYKGH